MDLGLRSLDLDAKGSAASTARGIGIGLKTRFCRATGAYLLVKGEVRPRAGKKRAGAARAEERPASRKASGGAGGRERPAKETKVRREVPRRQDGAR